MSPSLSKSAGRKLALSLESVPAMEKVRLPSVNPPLPSPKSTTRPGGAERNQSTLPSPLKSNSTCERDELPPRVTLVGVKLTWPGVELLIHHWLPPSW